MFKALSVIVLASALSGPLSACDTALLLTIDVSNSIDAGEFRLQTDGLAAALEDGAVVDALLAGKVALSVMQWSGVDRQMVAIPWTRMDSETDIAAFAARARAMERGFTLSDTAPAEAIRFAMRQFDQVPDCKRRVIDVSGDGTANAGTDTRMARNEAERAGITINGIAIESLGVAITNFFERAIITRDGFVITARGYLEYPEAIRRKILRETARVLY